MSTLLAAPKYSFPHTEVNVHDNSEYQYNPVKQIRDGTKMLFVVRSPRGVDGVLTQIDGPEDMESKFGRGTFANYGQPLLNAFAAIDTGYVNAVVERIVAEDAARANLCVYLKPQIAEADESDAVSASYEEEGGEAKTMQHLVLTFVANSIENLLSDDVEDLRAAAEANAPEGYYFLFAFASKGRGAYGNNISFQIASNSRKDIVNDYKNYTLTVYENNTEIESATFAMYPHAVTTAKSISLNTVINDPACGSENLIVAVNEDILSKVVDAYNTAIYDKLTDYDVYQYALSMGLKNIVSVSADGVYSVDRMRAYLKLDDLTFDMLTGTNKYLVPRVTKRYLSNESVPIINFRIQEVEYADQANEEQGIEVGDALNIVLDSIGGNRLHGGTEGAFELQSTDNNLGGTSTTADDVTNAINTAYRYAFAPHMIPTEKLAEDKNKTIRIAYDEFIYSHTRYPLNLILDANYDEDTKIAISTLAETRNDCEVIFDIGTDCKSKEDALSAGYGLILSVGEDWHYTIESYSGKVYDPVSKKIVTVTGTYPLASNLPTHYNTYSGKHIPFAGQKYGELSGFIKSTVYPLMDEDLDGAIMQNFYDYRVNYAQLTSSGTVIRGAQNTAQSINSALTEMSNAQIVLDIKHDVEDICNTYHYNFFDTADLKRFNDDCNRLVEKYAAAQVLSIGAQYESDEEDEAAGILHLVINMVHKKLVKVAVVDINVNRSDSDSTTV